MKIDFDPSGSETIANPFPAFRRLQDDDPVHWSAALNGWIVTRYADAIRVLTNPAFSADRITPFQKHLSEGERGEVDRLVRGLSLWAEFNDPPRHTRLRALINKAFTPKAVERMAPRIQSVVDELIDGFAHKSQVDLIADFAYPLPAMVIASMIGVANPDLEKFKKWSDDLATFVGGAIGSRDKRARAQRGIGELTDFFASLLQERRHTPSDDILSGLIAAEERGDALSEEEIVATCVMLLFAGHETTTNLIGNGMLSLARHTEQRNRLIENPELIGSAIEECLRFDGPVQAMGRIAKEDIQLGQNTIRAGDRLFAMLNAANRDPRQFAAPDAFDIRRKDNRHIAFGAGIHYCVGAPLARLEGRIAIATLLRRMPEIAFDESRIEWQPALVLRGVKALPVLVPVR